MTYATVSGIAALLTALFIFQSVELLHPKAKSAHSFPWPLRALYTALGGLKIWLGFALLSGSPIDRPLCGTLVFMAAALALTVREMRAATRRMQAERVAAERAAAAAQAVADAVPDAVRAAVAEATPFLRTLAEIPDPWSPPPPPGPPLKT